MPSQSLSPELAVYQSLAPILVVEKVEPCLSFWTERLGFTNAGQVPHGDAIGFAMLVRDNVTVMYQSLDSVRDDVPSLAETPLGASSLYISVASIDDIEGKLEGVEQVIPRRRTFYGATEVAVREPAGNLVIFAEFEKNEAES
jgi:uncharacterized glyoxalase superfamily protein PhnB